MTMPDGFLTPGDDKLVLTLAKVEHAVLLSPGDEPQPPFYDDCREAWAVCAMAGTGMVVTRVTYESDWIPHAPH